ncbi:uncharacterized protein LOC131627051 [Vicia villosa]|uniref:uncharacterized protein LOC131627051 n=1 Tax=Vicia villosa TaxID=3911 RepID=UPI00273C15ED|nr:uncharacterized protein LOC131627051 [Vicia villosa]
MRRGRAKKKAAQTPPARVSTLSPTTNSSEGKGKSIDTEMPTLESIEEKNNTEKTQGEQKKSEAQPQLWVGVIKGNRLPSHGIGLEYTPPDLVDGEVEVENALILYAIKDDLSMNAVKKFIMNVWNFVVLPDLYYNKEGYFLVRFTSKEDKDAVLMRGPYTIFKKPILLHEWTPDFTLQDDVLRVLPIWVTFPQLPLKFWGDKSIGKIASAVGKPLMTDECTARKLRVSYAKVLIEVDVTVELKEEIMIRDGNSGKISQRVEYEWRPPFCAKCNKVGHTCKNKVEIPMKPIWKPKKNEVIQESEKPKETITQEDTQEKWNTVSKASQGKGKKPIQAPPEVVVSCTNGFDALKVGDCFESGGPSYI